MNNLALGVDIGGSGIKGGIVDTQSGELIGHSFLVPTPQPATPAAIAAAVATVVANFQWVGPVGIAVPSVITNKIARTAANIDPTWVGVDVYHLFGSTLNNPAIAVLNDADAAGLAEVRFGAGKESIGVVMLLTFGTGIGSAIIFNGVLLPNTELGHLEVAGREAEERASSKVKTLHELTYAQWSAEVSLVLKTYETLFWPSLFIVGGGISNDAEKWIPLLTVTTPVVPAQLRNTAGIVGAALSASLVQSDPN